MITVPPQADPVASGGRESATDQLALLFQSLPSLESLAYLELLKTATAGELPASVLSIVVDSASVHGLLPKLDVAGSSRGRPL